MPYRDLYDRILDYEGPDLHEDVVRPWLRLQDDERRWLADFSKRKGDPIPPATTEELWRLYGLSRIADLLQPDHAELMESLGMQRIERAAFHPFFHEVVTVDPSPGEPRIVEEYWPGYMLGPLLIARSGCRVAAGPEQLSKDIAEKSTLYWAFTRRHRRTDDLSKGWGSNSQWRTQFRRDYALDGRLHYNVDAGGGKRISYDDDLEPAERLELLRFRCFVKCPKRDDDRWPYDLHHREDAPA
jgi:hypothetical protein